MKFIVKPEVGLTEGYCYFPIMIPDSCQAVCKNNCGRVCVVDCISN
jgi:Cys-rich peptide (Clo7bot family)